MVSAGHDVNDAPAVTCSHCGVVVPPALVVEGAQEQFCCGGCRAAWQLLHSCDLAEFHRLRSGVGLPAAETDGAVFDSAGFAAAHVRPRSDGLAVVEWYVLGMHCPACVWLLERLPRLDDGIRTSRVQFGLGRLTVVYDPARTSPGRQAALAARLGYRLKPWRDQGGVTAEKRDLFLRFAVSAAAAIGAMHLSLNLYAGEISQDLGTADTRLFGWLAVALALPAITWGAAPFWRGARAAWRGRRLGIDATAVLVIAVGAIASVANLLAGSRELYVDAVAMFVALLLLGRVAVLAARERVVAASAGLDHLLPVMARRRDGVAVPTAALMPGEIIAVHADEVLPADGVVIEAAAVIDQAVLTGESRPVTMPPGANCWAGSTCRSPHLLLSVTATGTATRIGAIITGLGGAADRPARLPPLADRLAAWFTPLMVLAAVLVWLGWWWAGLPGRGLDQAIALVLVSCPCALGLATPLVQAVTIARAARRGLLIRDPAIIEVLGGGRLAHAVFDKTGTLTVGRLQVVGWEWLGVEDAGGQGRITAIAAAAEDRSQHPIALALSTHLAQAERATLGAWSEIPAQGITCTADGAEWRIGHAAFAVGTPADDAPGLDAGSRVMSTVLISRDGRPVARILLGDPLRAGITDLLTALDGQGVVRHLASGDDTAVAGAVGRVLGFTPARIHGRQSPEDKAALVARLTADGPVAMVGDGLNDAAAMGAADAAIGLSGGLESALGACHAFITRPDADRALVELWTAARRARRRIRLILGVSLAYNAVGVALAAAGVWGPYLCAVAMPVSSLTAVLLAVAGPAHDEA